MRYSNSLAGVARHAGACGVLAILILLGLTACGDPAPAEFRIATITTENQADTAKRYAPVAAHLAARLGMTVSLREVSDYAAVVEALRSRRLELAFMGPASYAKAWQVTNGNVEPILSPVELDGAAGYSAAMLVSADSPFQKLDDLRGRSFASVDPNSTSGYQAVQFFLTREGKNPAQFFSRTGFSGSHENSVMAVLNGSYDAATVWWSSDQHNAVQRMARKGMVDARKLRVVWQSPRLPADPWVIRKDLPDEQRRRVREALLEFRTADPEGWKLHTDGLVGNWVPASHADYAMVVEMLDANLRQRVEAR